MSRDGGWELSSRPGPGGPRAPQLPRSAGAAGAASGGDPEGLERTAVAHVPGISPSPDELSDGLGGYRFGHHIGQTGDVYEAEHPRFQGRLALKMFRRAAGIGSAAIDAFSREAGRVSILRHPHIAQVMESGALRDGTPFVSMELLSGLTLDEVLNGRGALLASELLPLVRGIASALTAAHAAGIVHREIRPDNIFVVELAGYEHGFAKVLDFGVSRLTAAERAGGRGTGGRAPSYLAPEQIAGRIEEITEAADQFALGALAYRLLSGSDPFVAHARPRGLDRVGDGKAGVVAPLARRAPAVDAVVSKAMSRHPGDRFESVALFFRAFDEALAGSALISTPMPVVASRDLAPAAPPAETRPLVQPIQPVMDGESAHRRTLFGAGPNYPRPMRDQPTREVPVHDATGEVTPPPTAKAATVAAAPRWNAVDQVAPPPRPSPEAAFSVPRERPHTPRRARPAADQDGVTLSERFFEDGERQESEAYAHSYRDPNVFAEPEHRFKSFDRVPKSRAPLAVALLVLLSGGAGAAWWAGWRPPLSWQESNVWKTLRLPAIPPAAASGQGTIFAPPDSPAVPAGAVPTSPAPATAPAAAAAQGAPSAENAGAAAVPAGDTAAPAPADSAPAEATRAAPAEGGRPAGTPAEAQIPPSPSAAAPSPAPPASRSAPSSASSRSASAQSSASSAARRPSALHGFVWSRSEKAFVPADTATAPPAPSPAPDEPPPPRP